MKHPLPTRTVFCILFLIRFLAANAQFFSSGNEPFNVRWQSIETEKYKIIFPSGIYQEANRFANCIDNSYPYLHNSMPSHIKQIPIILHNQNVLSNGFVTWAPKRMEIITTPSRDFYSQDWLENLALHEYRHVLQVYCQNKGFTKLLSLLTGQTGMGLPVSQIPLWLNEGDAVISETIFSESGRGSIPAFQMPFKACVLRNEKDFSYDKYYFGSYKDHVPDYYRLGFYLTSYARIKHGKDIWNKTIEHVGKFSFIPYSLDIGLKKLYNTSRRKLFHETIDTLKSLWTNENINLDLTNYLSIPVPETDCFTSYKYVHPSVDSSIIAFKSSIDELNSIVHIDNKGKETILHIPGYVYENRLSCGTNLIVWDEIMADPRWQQRNYSIIKSYDLSTGKVKSLTNKSRLFSPCINKEDKKIALIQIDTENNSSLVIIDAISGNETYRRTSPVQGLLSFPVWYGSDSIITALTTHKQGKQLYALDLTTGNWKKISTPTFENISQLSIWKEYIIFSAGFSGIDNIYALSIKSNELHQLTSSRYGAFEPFVDEKSDILYYSQYTEKGFRPVRKNIIKADWISFSEPNHLIPDWAALLAEQEPTLFPEEASKDTVYTSKKYSRLANLFNIHSWMPFYFDSRSIETSDLEIKPGVTILSQNILSTSISSIGLIYENKNFIVRPSFVYKGFLPVFDFSSTIGGPNKQHVLPAGVVPKDTTFPFFKFALNTYTPLRRYNNKFHKLLQPEIDLEYENTLFYENGLRKGILFVHYKVLLYRHLMLSYRDIYPKWGQSIRLTFTHTPFESSQYGILTSASGVFYFPGIANHHSLILYGGFQYREIENRQYYYSVNRISLPRGYYHVMNEPLARMISKFSINYGLTLMYPDLSLGSPAYIKRIRSNVFADFSYAYDLLIHTENQTQYSSKYYSSLGLDIISDLHLFRFYFPVSLGLRFLYIPHFENIYPEIILSIDTSAF